MADFKALYNKMRRTPSYSLFTDSEFHLFTLDSCYEISGNDFNKICRDKCIDDEDSLVIDIEELTPLEEALKKSGNGIHRVAFRKNPRVVFDMIAKTYELEIEDCSESCVKYYLVFNDIVECVA